MTSSSWTAPRPSASGSSTASRPPRSSRRRPARSSASCSRCAPVAVAHAKRVLDAAAKPALATTLALEVTAQALCARTDDFAEATRAFAEKREPEFSGR